MRIDDSLVQKYRKGTVPGNNPSAEEMDNIAAFLLSTAEWAQDDYEKGVFNEYNEYTTSTKVTLGNVEDALAFNLYQKDIRYTNPIINNFDNAASCDVDNKWTSMS